MKERDHTEMNRTDGDMVPWEPHPQHTNLQKGGITAELVSRTARPAAQCNSSGLKGFCSIRGGNPFTNPTASTNGRGTVGTLVSEWRAPFVALLSTRTHRQEHNPGVLASWPRSSRCAPGPRPTLALRLLLGLTEAHTLSSHSPQHQHSLPLGLALT